MRGARPRSTRSGSRAEPRGQKNGNRARRAKRSKTAHPRRAGTHGSDARAPAKGAQDTPQAAHQRVRAAGAGARGKGLARCKGEPKKCRAGAARNALKPRDRRAERDESSPGERPGAPRPKARGRSPRHALGPGPRRRGRGQRTVLAVTGAHATTPRTQPEEAWERRRTRSGRALARTRTGRARQHAKQVSRRAARRGQSPNGGDADLPSKPGTATAHEPARRARPVAERACGQCNAIRARNRSRSR